MRPHILWSAIEAGGSALFSVLGSFVIAHLIGPAELGIGAAAAAVHVLLWVGVNALFADALVQRADVDEAIASSAFWASGAVGLLAVPIQIGSGFLLATALDEPRLIPIGLILALPLPLVGAGGALQGMATRGRRYGLLAARTLFGQGSGAALGIAVALNGGGCWALAAQLATASFIGALTLVLAGGWRPRMVWSWPVIRALLAVGLPLTGATIIQIGRYRLFAILIGGTAGPAALGQVHMAFRLVDTVRDLSFTALWRLMLPIMAEAQQDRPRLIAAVDRLLARSAAVMLPLCAVMAIGLVPIVSLLLGPRWMEAGHAARPLVGLMVLSVAMFPSGVALVAAGHARQALFANIAGMAATVALVLAIRPTSPNEAVWVWCAGQAAVSPYILWASARALGVGLLRPMAGIGGAFQRGL